MGKVRHDDPTIHDDRLYCTTCKEQPEYFEEVVRWQLNWVRPDGTHIRNKNGSVDYQCPVCGREASWGYDLNE